MNIVFQNHKDYRKFCSSSTYENLRVGDSLVLVDIYNGQFAEDNELPLFKKYVKGEDDGKFDVKTGASEMFKLDFYS
jgi:hypothetical protein